MNILRYICLFPIAIAVVLFADFVAIAQTDDPPQQEIVELTDEQMAALMEAPKFFMVDEPSAELRRAMDAWSVQRIRADRFPALNSFVVQGWILFEPTDEVRPIILCLSETGQKIEWMWCQEETRRLEGECS